MSNLPALHSQEFSCVVLTSGGLRPNSEVFTTYTGAVSGTGLSLYSYSIPNTNGYQPNGNVVGFTDYVLGTDSFTYDHLNRLTGGSTTTGPCTGIKITWAYDNWGNRQSETFSGTSPCTAPSSYSAQYSTENQVTFASTAASGYAYDGRYYSGGSAPSGDAGNVTYDGLNTYAYDAEGRVCAVQNGTTHSYSLYTYDADGQRVAKGSITPPNGTAVTNAICNVSANAFSITESYDLLPDGRISQMFSNGLWQNNNVYANGNVLATYSGSSMYFQMNDWLGTKRAQISSDGNTANFNTWYSLPYGNSQIQSGGQDVNGLHFTGKERDLETAPGTGNGNDYFGARYYGSSMGRFLSPDWADKPEAVPYSDLSNPQSLNLYGYVKNNPLRSADPDGHEDCCDDLLQFAGGVVQGAASSVSFGLIGVPRSSDSNASLAGQLVGTSIIGGTGTSVVSESGPTAVAGLALAPETGGASLVVSAGAVGASGVGSEMVAGAAKNGAAVAAVMAMKGDNGADKGASPGTGKDRTLEGKTSQVKDIQEAQKNARAGKTKKLIDSTNKSEQNLDNHLKDIHHLSDVE